MKWLVGLPLIIAVSVPITLLGGVVLSDHWRWFIVPTFNIPQITYLQAVGLMMVIGFFKIGLKTEKFTYDTEAHIASLFAQAVGYALIYLLSWGVGAVWSLFI